MFENGTETVTEINVRERHGNGTQIEKWKQFQHCFAQNMHFYRVSFPKLSTQSLFNAQLANASAWWRVGVLMRSP